MCNNQDGYTNKKIKKSKTLPPLSLPQLVLKLQLHAEWKTSNKFMTKKRLVIYVVISYKVQGWEWDKQNNED